MKEKFQRFMTGRYGVDQFSQFLMYCFIILCILNLFIRSNLLNFFIILLMIYCYYRVFSKNLNKRYAENAKYLSFKEKGFQNFRKEKSLLQERKKNHIYSCPNCKQKIRVPKRKGKIVITCPKCRTEFTKRS